VRLGTTAEDVESLRDKLKSLSRRQAGLALHEEIKALSKNFLETKNFVLSNREDKMAGYLKSVETYKKQAHQEIQTELASLKNDTVWKSKPYNERKERAVSYSVKIPTLEDTHTKILAVQAPQDFDQAMPALPVMNRAGEYEAGEVLNWCFKAKHYIMLYEKAKFMEEGVKNEFLANTEAGELHLEKIKMYKEHLKELQEQKHPL
jgi:hypothetical protein